MKPQILRANLLFNATSNDPVSTYNSPPSTHTIPCSLDCPLDWVSETLKLEGKNIKTFWICTNL